MNNDERIAATEEALQRQNRAAEAAQLKYQGLLEQLKQATQAYATFLHELYPPNITSEDRIEIETRIEDLVEQRDRLKEAEIEQERALRILVVESSKILSGHDDAAAPRDLPTLIDQSRSTLSGIKERHRHIQENIDRLRTQLSPIRLLPAEILAEIFTLCHDNELEVTNISLTAGPLPISHVCSTWRTISINKSDLWSTIFLRLERRNEQVDWSRLVDLWLKRSHHHPLSLYIKVEHALADTFIEILGLFALHSYRWKAVEIVHNHTDMSWPDGCNYFDKISPQTKHTLLENLKIRTSYMSPKEAEKLAALTAQAPRLHTVYWKVSKYHDMPKIPWAQLTELVLMQVTSLQQALDLLSIGHQLSFLHLMVDIKILGQYQISSHVSHRCLKTLELSYAGDMQVLLSNISLPALTTMLIENMSDPTELSWHNESFVDFLSRSGCALQHLGLTDPHPLEPNDIILLLQKISSSLITFESEGPDVYYITDEVLKALTYPAIEPNIPLEPGNMTFADDTNSTTAVLCPMLQHLSITGCIYSTEDGVLADMIESRLPKNNRQRSPSLKALKKAKLATRGFIYRRQPNNLARLSTLDEEGIIYSSLP